MSLEKKAEKIRVIFLVDSLCISRWAYEVYGFVSTHQEFQIVGIVLNTKPIAGKNSFLYKWLRRIDRKALRFFPDPFDKVEIENEEKTSVIKVTPVQRKFSDFFAAEDIDELRKLEPDLMIRFGFRILRGDILSIAPLGIWSLHHADNDVNRGGPPGFWEVAKKEPVTGVTLQRLSEDLDGGTVIGKSFIKTDHTSFNRNQASLFWAGVELFKSKLNALAKGELTMLPYLDNDKTQLPIFYSYPLYKDTDNLSSIRYGASLAIRAVKRKVEDVLYFQQWSIGYTIKSGIETSLFRYKYLTPPKNCIWADPFLVEATTGTYLFAEQKYGSKPGEIICFKYEAVTKAFEFLGVVLKEPFHLSYPFVFENNGRFYMIPESGDSKQVILYEAQNFPFNWQRKKVLIDNIAAYDATLHQHEGIWYMFATVKANDGLSANELLHIYYTDELIEGEWKSHEMNPVKHDVRGARPAGKLFEHNGKLIRPGQIGAHKYGFGIQFFEVTELTPNTFKERPVREIKPYWNKNLLATHTFNHLSNITVIDIQKLVCKF